jgi:hypothetical protein
MKKTFLAAVIAAVLMAPGLAGAQTIYYRTDLSDYRDRIADSRAQLAHDQDVLARDRAFGNWWAISGDVWRVRQDRAQLADDIASYDNARGAMTRTYTYRYYRY